MGADIGRKWDIEDTRLDGRVGPTLNYVNTIQGLGPDDVSYFSWRGKAQAMNHLYEAFIGNQFEGWISDIEYNGQRKGLGSPLNVDRYEARMKYLWNLGGYSPPLFVLAWRAEAVVVNSTEVTAASESDVDKSRELLPIDYRVFYGGDRNLRGFTRQSLDNEAKGYLTAISTGVELRLIEELPKHFQPFLLFDAAKLGDRRLVLGRQIFSSWGLGMRWPSPIGTIRGSAAKGEISSPGDSRYKTRWVFFLSLGQEF
jgi:outer membrane translocation and assembly module TamA